MKQGKSKYDSFFEVKPGRNKRRLNTTESNELIRALEANGDYTSLRESVQAICEKILQEDQELARGEYAYTLKNIYDAVQAGKIHVWAQGKVKDLTVEFAWDFRDTQRKLEALIANLPPDVDIL